MAKLTLVPLHGVQYITVLDAVEDWDRNKDFRAYPGGFHISKRDIESVKLHYKECIMKLPNLGLDLQIF